MPWKVICVGVTKNPGLDPVDCEMRKLVRWNAPVPTSVTCRRAVWFAAPAVARADVLAPAPHARPSGGNAVGAAPQLARGDDVTAAPGLGPASAPGERGAWA